MPAALSTDDPTPRTWWNTLSKTPSSRDLRQAYVQEQSPRTAKPGKLNSFASAIGFKSKKQSPTLAIQDPPPTLVQYVSTSASPPSLPATRPPSKSISSSRTRVDSIEPRTPVDFQRDHRHSLLTLSDTDPFAGRPMIAVPVPHLPSDPNCLSAYSNPSVTELVHKKHEHPTPNRISYASSSSNSNSHAIEIPVTEPLRLTKPSERRQLATKRSIGSLQFKRAEPLHRQASVTPSMTSFTAHSKADSSSTLLDPHRRSQQAPAAPPRPKLRTRGMTDSGTSKTSGFFVEEQPSVRKISPKPSSSDIPSSQEASTSTTRVVTRQASMSRIQPPSAPPTHRLPPPPPPPGPPAIPTKHSQRDGPTIHQRMGLSYRTSAASSSVSYISSESLPGSPYGAVDKSSQPSGLSHGFEPDNLIKSRTLKKALSHQSLTRRGLASPPPAPPPPPPTPPDTSGEKRKQRSFHHPRLPIPPIPLPNIRSLPSSANSTAFPASATTSDSGASIFDKRRGSSGATSTSSRRRLFSTSSRPSTSHHPPTTREDDTLSVFSVRSDTDSHFTPYKPWVNRERKTPSSSFWEEGSSDPMVSSPVRSNDYSGPQAIMSRAELAKLEASVDRWSLEHSTKRSRGMSILSSSTAASDMSRDSDILSVGLSPRPNSKQMAMGMSGAPMSPSGPHSRPTSVVSDHEQQQRQQQQQQQRYPLSSTAMQAAARTASPDMMSLPPPPRRRKGAMISEPDVPEDAVAPTRATSPTASASATPTPSLMSSISRAPSTLKLGSGSMRSKYSVGKNPHRRSLMRKPSFLDIDDDDDDDDQQIATMGGRMTGTDSFLDLARESFDTVRTEL